MLGHNVIFYKYFLLNWEKIIIIIIKNLQIYRQCVGFGEYLFVYNTNANLILSMCELEYIKAEKLNLLLFDC